MEGGGPAGNLAINDNHISTEDQGFPLASFSTSKHIYHGSLPYNGKSLRLIMNFNKFKSDIIYLSGGYTGFCRIFYEKILTWDTRSC
jgi:hypothetical protein